MTEVSENQNELVTWFREGLASWLLFVTFNCVFVAFPCGGLGWVSDLCRLSYFYATLTHLRINAESHQKYIRVTIDKNPRDFYAILGLRVTFL